jgi:hypothetical protein
VEHGGPFLDNGGIAAQVRRAVSTPPGRVNSFTRSV